MLSSTYLPFEILKFCITETNFRMTSPRGLTFRTDKKIRVKFLEIIFNREKNKSIILQQFEAILIF